MTRTMQVLFWCVLAGAVAVGSPTSARDTDPSAGPSQSTNRQAATAAEQAAPSEFQIGPEDVLEILVWKSPELSRTVAVRPDGRISMPLLNDITVWNLTPMQLRDQLTKGFARYFEEPEVSVIVKEIHSLKISVVGMVKTPGRYELRSRTTVLEALALAGGTTDFAKTDRIVVYRQNGRGEVSPLGFDYKRLLGDLDAKQNFVLIPGDIVVVP